MKVKRFAIKGFRGLWEFSEGDFPEQSLIIYGRNGTGKTSCYHALRFGVTGHIPKYFPDGEADSLGLSRHVMLKAEDPTAVTVELVEDGAEHSISREISGDGTISETYSSEDPMELGSDPMSQLCFLDRDRFTRMVDAAERDRWQSLSPLLGHEDLANYREGIRKFHLSLRQDLEITRREAELEETQSRIRRLSQQVLRHKDDLKLSEVTAEGLKDELLDLLTPPQPEEPPEGAEPEAVKAHRAYRSLADAKRADELGALDWQALRTLLGGSEVLRQLSDRLSEINRRSDLLSFEVFAEPKRASKEGPDQEEAHPLSGLINLLERLHDDPEVGHQVLHAEFFNSAKAMVADYVEEPCPLCDLSPDDWESVRSRLSSRAKQLEKVVGEKQRIEEEARSLASRLRSVHEDFEKHEAKYELTEEDVRVRNALRAGADWVELAVARIRATPPTGFDENERKALQESLDELAAARTAVANDVSAEKRRLEAEIAERDEDPTRVRFLTLEILSTSFAELEKAWKERNRISAWCDAAAAIVDRLAAYSTRVQKEEGSLSAKVLEAVERRMAEIFQAITENERLTPSIKREESRGVVRAEIMLEDFYGAGRKPAREYLSESYRNTLGLAIYFAGMEHNSPKLRTLVMDDITHPGSCTRSIV